MSHFLMHYWTQFKGLGLAHGVDPVIFAVLYALHYLFLWSMTAWIIVSFRRNREIGNLISIWVFILISPWFYPLFFGRNIPWYIYVLGVGGLTFIAWHGYHKIQNRIVAERAVMNVVAETAEETV